MFHPSDHAAELSEEEFRLLRDLIHERFGLFFADGQRPSLRARLAGRLASLDLLSFEDYYHYLRFGPQRDEELQRMVTYLTNNETYFFREQTQLKVFADPVLRSLRDAKSKTGDKTLRILSAGCSTGEEAYSLAMIIYDSGQFFWSWNVQVFGMDVDRTALEKARRGVYFHNSFRSTDPKILAKHFAKEGTGTLVKEGVRRLVQFREGNLLDPASYAGLQPIDAILCRNVLIYFSPTTMRKVMRQFHDVLAPGGYLLLGHAESLSRINDVFVPIRFPGALIYQKPAQPEATA